MMTPFLSSLSRPASRRRFLLSAAAGVVIAWAGPAGAEQPAPGSVTGHVLKDGSPVSGLKVMVLRRQDSGKNTPQRKPTPQATVHKLGEPLPDGGSDSKKGDAAKHEGDAHKYQAVTDSAGGFSFTDLAPGVWGVLCTAEGGYKGWTVVTVASSQTVDATVNLEKKVAPTPRGDKGTQPAANGDHQASQPSGRK